VAQQRPDVRSGHVYSGITLAYYGGAGGLEYDFIVFPGADASAIALKFDGASGVDLSPQGDLVVHTAAGDLVQHAPVLYQDLGGIRQPVAGRFTLNSGLVGFEVSAYDRSRPLVIDPLVLGYSTYLGGTADDVGEAVTVDGKGSAYVTGITGSTNFPTTPGVFDTGYNGNNDAFVARLNTSGNALVFGTYLGGTSGYDFGQGIAVDGAGSAYLTGVTSATDFPTTPGAFQTLSGGGSDAFVAKLSANGSVLAYGTYLGGSMNESGDGIGVDSAGNAYVAGNTHSDNFPTTPNAFDPTYNGGKIGWDAFMVKLNGDGSALAYGSYLGGAKDEGGYAIAVDGAGSAYVTGYTNSGNFPSTPGAYQRSFNGGPEDAYVTKVSPDGGSLVYSSFLGGTWDDEGMGIAVDATGNAYVTGTTNSTDFPTTPGAFDTTENGWSVFVVKLNSAGSAIAYGTFLGSDISESWGIAVDGAGNAYVTGDTNSAKFPVTADAVQTKFGGDEDAFFTKLNAGGTGLVYSTYLGGSNGDGGTGVAVDAGGNAYVTGGTASSNFPTTPGALKLRNRNGINDAFVTKFAEVQE
jgi:hypothetical protein